MVGFFRMPSPWTFPALPLLAWFRTFKLPRRSRCSGPSSQGSRGQVHLSILSRCLQGILLLIIYRRPTEILDDSPASHEEHNGIRSEGDLLNRFLIQSCRLRIPPKTRESRWASTTPHIRRPFYFRAQQHLGFRTCAVSNH